MSTTLKRIGRKIREVRKAMGLSQERLAAKAELDRTYIGAIERGQRNISIVSLEKIAKALDIELYVLFKASSHDL